ncbi:MAG: hypothetical protein RIS20_1927 [Bacteroidota bacterium]|jgi:hypothetical protein
MKKSSIIILLFCFVSCQFSNRDKQNNDRHISISQNSNLEIVYFSNGHVKEISEQGHFGPCGVETGKHFYFDFHGRLKKLVSISNKFKHNSKDCMDLITFKRIYYFDSNGKLNSIKYFRQNYEGVAHPVKNSDDMKF